MPPLIQLLDLPDHVSRGDFVQSLAESLRRPEQTVADYAVTGALQENFRESLKVVAGAISSGRSQPVFLHGSFGSGKSHFMAILHLILQGEAAPWGNRGLHPVREAYAPLEGKRLLQLHFHMLGAESLETAVFREYVDFVRRAHPDAPLPGLFRDEEVFDNARALRQTLGDEAFFGALNQGKQVIPGLGLAGAADRWTAERFEDAATSADAKARRKLFDDLVRTLLPAFASLDDRFVDIDEGLGELSRHAASLGYDGVVLYLDELILWLASRSADLSFVQREINKLVKLKEARDERRDVPIVAFIARQRDLSELVGDAGTGAERALIEETFAHHKSRFHTIELADSNLRAIIPHRVVRARDAQARQALESGFGEMWRAAQAALRDLQGGDATQAEFRQVYPFSPALIDALVALSDRLQRDRTAIRILVEMLVEHLPDLELGEVVPIGDAFDLVASSDDAVDGPSAAAFRKARELYLFELLPRVRAKHNTGSVERCQRLRDGHPLRLGCSGCAQTACRNDNRLLKTALLAALVPRAKPFEGLTVSRLVHLNHGAVKAPLESMRLSRAATALRHYANDVHALKVGEDADAAVAVSLDSVDLKPILERARDQDTPARRRSLLRKRLFDAMGVTTDSPLASHPAKHHFVSRVGKVRFGNVRVMGAEELRCDAAEWQVVVDYPFDEAGYTPHDDEQRVAAIREQLNASTATLVWLPTFFSQRVLDALGELARLEHVLTPGLLRGYLEHLPPDTHQQARVDLESLRDRKRLVLDEALRKAYGLSTPLPDDADLDLNRSVQEHVLSLHDLATPRTPRGATLADGLNDLAEQLLEARYPRHPKYTSTPSSTRIHRVREILECAIEAGGMLPVDKGQRSDLEAVAQPLSLCRVHAQQVEVLGAVFDRIDAALRQRGVEEPSAEQVFRWVDPDGIMGLDERANSLIAWLWAVRQRRVAKEGGRTLDWPSTGRLNPYTIFVTPDLPGETDFNLALDRARMLQVNAQGRALNARNASALAEALRKKLDAAQALAAQATPALLGRRLGELGGPRDCARARTAETLSRLLAAMESVGDRALLEAVARADLSDTSPTAIGRAWIHAEEVKRALEGHAWTVIGLALELEQDPEKEAAARALRQDALALLAQDELAARLGPGVRELADRATALRAPRPEPRPPGWSAAWQGERRALPGARALAELDALRAELAAALTAAGDAETLVSLRLDLQVRKAEGER